MLGPVHPPDLPTLRAAVWTVRALRRTRRSLRRHGLAGTEVLAPPPLPATAERGVRGVLRRLPATCLEAALVQQRWEAAHGRSRDVVIGVTSPADPAGGFRAHAWLESTADGGPYEEIHRLPGPR
jgi:hypothetical protein